MRVGDIGYARAGDHHIAFRELEGERGGDHEIVVVNDQFWPMESLTNAPPRVERLFRGLADLGRVILFDRRGIALSDPITDWETSLVEQWADDLAAVIDAAGCERPAVFSWMSVPVAPTCAVRHPELISKMVLFNPSSPVTAADDEWVQRFVENRSRNLAGEDLDRQGVPAGRADPEWVAWHDAAGRAGASPSLARRITWKSLTDPHPDFASVALPTLVIARLPEDSVVPLEFMMRAAHTIPDAELVVLPPGDGIAVGLGVDDVLAEITRFLTGRVQLPPPDRQLVTVLFTDLVDSTRRAVSSGDAAWKLLLDHHDDISRHEVSRHGGEIVKTTGDGVLALLPSVTAAVETARQLRARLDAEDGLVVRIGIHVGEIDRRGDDVSGVAVNAAARIMAAAAPGQILASGLVRDLSDAVWAPVGEQALKGIDGSWELHELR